jgi:hypothetical protein
MRKCTNILNIYEEVVSHIWLCTRSHLNFPIDENFVFFFISLVGRYTTNHVPEPTTYIPQSWTKNLANGPVFVNHTLPRQLFSLLYRCVSIRKAGLDRGSKYFTDKLCREGITLPHEMQPTGMWDSTEKELHSSARFLPTCSSTHKYKLY